ncbi:hypothetical protein PLICRDRAFT_177062 [Plicaturopsis crispa FD-325 SS-3]|nr:hypothetical protein PLICRDRAFT_177062 [Plicaturopsis crispa FD-325 SS-3]
MGPSFSRTMRKIRDRFKQKHPTPNTVVAPGSGASVPPPGQATASKDFTNAPPLKDDAKNDSGAPGKGSTAEPAYTRATSELAIPDKSDSQIVQYPLFLGAKTIMSALVNTIKDVPAPGVQTIFSVVHTLLQTVEKTPSNSEHFKKLDAALSNLMNLLDQFGGDNDIPDPLGSQVTVLKKQIGIIHAKFEEKFGQNGLKHVLDGTNGAREAIQLFTDFSIKIETFSIHCKMQDVAVS